MKLRLVLPLLLVMYAFLVVPFSAYLKNRPVSHKLGFMPESRVLKVIGADHVQALAEYAVVKVLFYFGTIVEKNQERVVIKPEYFQMYKMLENSVKLDPYNMDAYYFAQAAFTWELGRAKDVNAMLAYGMKYRTWDFQLPFFAGFNASFFLKDYTAAAMYMKRAAELSGNPLFTTLAARYFYEAGQHDLGILFLDTMTKGAKDRQVKKAYELRGQALRAVRIIDKAMESYAGAVGRKPESLEDLTRSGFLATVPKDPYGGRFYLENGVVRSTSKFAFGTQPGQEEGR